MHTGLKKLLNCRHVVFASILMMAGCATQPAGPGMYYGQQVVMPGYTSFTHPQTIEHVVGPYETLWRISKTYNVDMDTLIRTNNISNPNKLKKGQRLTIPQTRGPRPVISLYPTQRWTHIVIHHTATHEGNALSIDGIHQRRGFINGMGYHFIIDNGTNGKIDGQIEVGPRWLKQQNGAHANAAGMNEKGIGIALVGNFSESYVSEGQMASLIFLVKTLQDYYNIPMSRIIRHSDVPTKNTECPGTHFPWTTFKNNL